MRIEAHGVAVQPPNGWSAQIFRRSAGPGEESGPVLHAATIPLPRQRADFGSNVAAQLGAADALVVLFGYGPSSVGQPLFAISGLPRPGAGDFDPRQLQRTIPGQAGYQRFFSWQGRPFCLYVVIGSYRHRGELAGRVHDLLDGIRLTALPAGVR